MSAAAPARAKKSLQQILDQDDAFTRELAPESKAWKIPLPEHYTFASLRYMLTPLAYGVLLEFGKLRYDKHGPCLLWAKKKAVDLAVELGNVKYTEGGRIVGSPEGVEKALLELEKKQLLEIKELNKQRKYYRVREENFPSCNVPDVTPSKSAASEEDPYDDGESDTTKHAGEKLEYTVRIKVGSVKIRKHDRHVNSIHFNGGGMVADGILDVKHDEKGVLYLNLLQDRNRTAVPVQQYSSQHKNGVRENGSGYTPAIAKFLETVTTCGVKGTPDELAEALKSLGKMSIEHQLSAAAFYRKQADAGHYPRYAKRIDRYVDTKEWTNLAGAKTPSSAARKQTFETAAERRAREKQEQADHDFEWADSIDKARGVS